MDATNFDAADQIDTNNLREHDERRRAKRNERERLEQERVKEEARLKRHLSFLARVTPQP